MNNGSGDLQSKYESNSAWADRIALLIVAGLATEIAAVFILGKPPLEGALTIVANLLIVLGVWGELIFARRAKEAGDGIVAEANARAAEANQKAREAELALEEFKAPRLLNEEQRGRIVDKLKQFSGTEYDIAISDSEPEILSLVFAIELVLSTAGWTELDWKGTGEALIRGGKQPLIRLGASVTNVFIGAHTGQAAKLFEFALALSNALNAEGVEAIAERLIPHEMSSTNPNAIHIMVGRKQ